MQDKLINIETKETHLCNKVTIEGYDYFVDISRLAEPHEKFINESICPKEYLFKPLIATTNPSIDCPKVVEVVDEVWEFEEEYFKNRSWGSVNPINQYKALRAGYNKAKETYPFSEKDMIEFADFVEKSNYDSDGFTQHQTPQELLQLFKQQKQQTIYFKN